MCCSAPTSASMEGDRKGWLLAAAGHKGLGGDGRPLMSLTAGMLSQTVLTSPSSLLRRSSARAGGRAATVDVLAALTAAVSSCSRAAYLLAVLPVLTVGSARALARGCQCSTAEAAASHMLDHSSLLHLAWAGCAPGPTAMMAASGDGRPDAAGDEDAASSD